MEFFDISPRTGMMDVLGSAGYSFSDAIADLIDNSIAANAKHVLIYTSFKSEKPYLYVLDDGDGMNLEKMKSAAIVGYKDIDEERETNDLGRYSTGLKSATNSICSNMILSSKEMGKNAHSINIDYKWIKTNNQWKAMVLDRFELSDIIVGSGTMVYCEDLKLVDNQEDIKSIYQEIDKLETNLSHIFYKYLKDDKLIIEIQNDGSKVIKVKPWNPFGLPHNQTTRKIHEEIINYKNSKICIKAYVLPNYSKLDETDQKYMFGKGLTTQQGFYVYRNERLIKEGGWLDLEKVNLDDKYRYARIEVEIGSELDKDFKVNFSKNSLVIPSDLKRQFIDIAKKTQKASKEAEVPGKILPRLEQKKQHAIEVWKTSKTIDGTALIINDEHPLILEICKDMSISDRKRLFSFLSKTIPIIQIQEQTIVCKQFTKEEMRQMINEAYTKLEKDGIPSDEIMKQIQKMEPFKSHRNEIIDYMDEKGLLK